MGVSSLTSLSSMRVTVYVPNWARYFNRKIQRRYQMNHKVKEHTFMEQVQVVIQQWCRDVRRIIGRPRPTDRDLDLEPGLQLSPSSETELYLIRLLNTYEIAKAIASGCHHADIRSLMFVSKGVRLAAQNCMSNTMLKEITCTLDQHRGMANEVVLKDCWGCGNQICPGCSSLRCIPRDKAFHLKSCSPYCSRCFRSRYCHSRSQKSGSYRKWRCHWLPNKCLGHGSRPITRQGQFSGRSTSGIGFEGEFREVCSLCQSIGWEEIAARPGWRGWVECGGNQRTLGPQKTTKIQCAGCYKGILVADVQRVWWACRSCRSECTEEFHDHELRARFHEKPGTGPANR